MQKEYRENVKKRAENDIEKLKNDFKKISVICKKYKASTLSDNHCIEYFIKSLPTFDSSISANLIIPATFIFVRVKLPFVLFQYQTIGINQD